MEFFKNIYNAIMSREPVMALAVLEAGLALGIGFGLALSGEQVALILAFVAALFGFAQRKFVSPIARTGPASGEEA
jgi:hypothetical protein